jgi:hypothetical protein
MASDPRNPIFAAKTVTEREYDFVAVMDIIVNKKLNAEE